MTFYSLEFFLFLPLVFIIYHYSGDRVRRLVLLLASVCFYAAFRLPHLVLALVCVVSVSYVIGLRIDASSTPGRRIGLLWLGIGANLLVLIAVKYLPFIVACLNTLASKLSWGVSLPESPLLVSIGVSYFVFQALSYIIDVYLKTEAAERDFVLFALYLSFFPKLLQGPIERTADLLPQLRAPYEFRYDVVRSGLLLFTWGMFKKLVVADRLALYVNMVYADVHGNSGTALLLATYLYAFQLLLDFSGYTDMARGVARLFNINLTQNFNAPYLATSVADFWRRWHISFSRWILDYIFKPLQMSFRDWGTFGTAFALFVTFLVSGIWHGASWGFVIWGLLHGLFLAVSVYYRPWKKRLYKATGLQGTWLQQIWQTVVTFNLVCFTWVFFRAASISDAWYIVTHVFSDIVSVFSHGGFSQAFQLGAGKTKFLQSLIPLSAVLLLSLVKDKVDLFARPFWFRWGAYYLLVYLILYQGVITSKATFVYFQF